MRRDKMMAETRRKKVHSDDVATDAGKRLNREVFNKLARALRAHMGQ